MSDKESEFLRQFKLTLVRGGVSLLILLIGWFGADWLLGRDSRQTVKANAKSIEVLMNGIDKKLDTELFDMYIGGINKLVQSNYELSKKDTDYNKEQIEQLESENKELRNDIKEIVKQIDFKTRGVSLTKQ